MSQFPIIKWINVDGRRVPFAYPQHEQLDGSFTETGEKNPLPTKDADLKTELELIKAQQKQILERLDNPINTQLTGSNVEDGIPINKEVKQELDKLIDAQTLSPNSSTTPIIMKPNGASEIYLFIAIDQQPWEIRYRNQFGNVSAHNGYPRYTNEKNTYSSHSPAISFPLGYRPDVQGIPEPTTIKEAKDWGLPITDSEYFMIYNHSEEIATVSVSILRVWR